VRRICPHCKVEYEPSPEALAFYERAGGTDTSSFFKGAGCNFCAHTGFLDRIGVFEVLQVTEDVRRLIVENAPNDKLRAVAAEQGMRTLANEAADLVAAGVTTIEEIFRTMFVFEPED
jgi:type IV pilus assembly protein PilB